MHHTSSRLTGSYPPFPPPVLDIANFRLYDFHPTIPSALAKPLPSPTSAQSRRGTHLPVVSRTTSYNPHPTLPKNPYSSTPSFSFFTLPSLERRPLAHLYKTHIKWILIHPCSLHPTQSLSLGKPIQPQDLEKRSTNRPSHATTKSPDSHWSMRMPMSMSMPMTKLIQSRPIRSKTRIHPHSIFTSSHRTYTSTNRCGLLHGSTLISQTLSSSSTHEPVSTEIGHFECRHLPRNLP